MEQGTVTDSDQARWNAHVEETLRMAAKCEEIWREKMKREESDKTSVDGFSALDDQEISPGRFWSWRCGGLCSDGLRSDGGSGGRRG